MVIVLHPEQAEQVASLARELEVDEATAVRMLLSGPLLTLADLGLRIPNPDLTGTAA